MPIPVFKHTFKKMKYGTIIGLTDWQDHVQSFFLPREGCTHYSHGDMEGFLYGHGRWRWSYDTGVQFWWSDDREKADVETLDRITSHLEKKYGLQFFVENGSLDWKHFNEQMEEENG